MRAVIWTDYGRPEVLQHRDIEKPVPQDNEVLIKVHATTVFPGDAELRRFEVPFLLLWLPMRLWIGLWKPKRVTILGQEVAGEVEAVGKDVTRFKAGDKVIGMVGMGFGGYAEYVCLTADLTLNKGIVALKPKNMSYEEAAAIPVGGLNAWHFIRRANIQPGEKVLINGSAGSIGSYAVQFAKSFGADVTAVDCQEKLDMLREIGADQVIDYQKGDFTRSENKYDVIFDIIDKASYSRCMKCLNPNGRLINVNTRPIHLLRAFLTSRYGNKKFICEIARVADEDFLAVTQLIEEGKVNTHIDRVYPLNKIVDAHRYVDTKMKAGHVILKVTQESNTV